ncbi:MAG: superinfection immunity protein [Saprospiraceae bacterium]|nr:superinfection immunity protein [Saprospiraceae bacterium]
MGALIIIAISFAVYFLPSIVGRNKENSASIILLNLFLGWTFVGWVVALVWAVSKDDNTKHYLLKIQAEQRNTLNKISDKNTNISISVSDEIRKLNDLKNQGLISEEEFEQLRKKLL